MKKSRTLWHIFLLLLYPAAEEVAAASEDALEVAFGAAFSVTCMSEENGTVPVWSFNGGGELPKEAVVNVNEDEGEVGTVTYSLEVSAANLDNVGEYRDEKYFRWHLQKWFTYFPQDYLKDLSSGADLFDNLRAIDCTCPKRRCSAGDSVLAANVVALVEDPPRVADFSRDEIVVMQGRRLELPECAASAGNPPPTAEWEGAAAAVIEAVTLQG